MPVILVIEWIFLGLEIITITQVSQTARFGRNINIQRLKFNLFLIIYVPYSWQMPNPKKYIKKWPSGLWNKVFFKYKFNGFMLFD